ncbi:MAG: zinc ABC transporter substrate-binding protein [Cyanobacteria bacterium J083]|nr:MAG: zinc ABC transporter substrate-binding protein [Cyanobacteria bacterium J083]
MSKSRPWKIFALLIWLGGCGSPTQEQIITTVKPRIVASYSILCELVSSIAAETVEMKCLIPPTESPHTYTPTPTDLKQIEQAQLILYGGYEFEPKIEQLIKNSQNNIPKVSIHSLAVPKPLLSQHEHETSHSHEEKLTADPHIWHDVRNTIKMTKIIAEQLSQVNPTQTNIYQTNSKELIIKLQKLDQWIKNQIATIPIEQRILVTTHEAFNYYAQAYGLKYLALLGLSSEETPSAAKIRQIVKSIKQSRVPTIFAEISANDRVINTIAREAKVKVAKQPLIADGLGIEENTDTYIEVMVHNTCTIVEGLGGECKEFK